MGRVALAGAISLIGAPAALAGAFGLHEQSAEALGESFAGVAAGAGGLSAMFWNPATLTEHAGIQTSSSYTLILPYASDTRIVGSSAPLFALPSAGSVIDPAFLPAGYGSIQLTDSLWAGVSITSPYGLTTKNRFGTAPGLWGMTTSIRSYDIAPQLAYRVNDWLSIGAGAQVMYFSVRETSAGSLIPGAVNELNGDSWGAGFTLGATLTPFDGTEIGVGYRSEVYEDLTGTLTGPFGPYVDRIDAPLTTPESVNLGVRQRLSPQWTLLGGAEWTNWSEIKNLTATSAFFPAPNAIVAKQALNYRDGWMFSLGAEYAWSQSLTLRAGGGYEISPIDDLNREVRLIDSDRVWLSVGASYQVNAKFKIDFGYAHVFYRDGTIDIPAGSTFPPIPLTYVGATSGRGDVVSLGLTYRWDNPVAAVVAKY